MLKLKAMPDETRDLFGKLSKIDGMQNFTLIGGTALALQIDHRLSEDLDFNVFGEKLPTNAIHRVLHEIKSSGGSVNSLISDSKKSSFRINTGKNLDDHLQDYLVNGVKVTFQSRSIEDGRTEAQIDMLKAAKKIEPENCKFNILGLNELFIMKSLVVYDRVKSRDIYDLMILTRDHQYSLDDAFDAIEKYQPLNDNNFERFKSVVTGLVTLPSNDEGFLSIGITSNMDSIYGYFTKLVNDYEISKAKDLFKPKA